MKHQCKREDVGTLAEQGGRTRWRKSEVGPVGGVFRLEERKQWGFPLKSPRGAGLGLGRRMGEECGCCETKYVRSSKSCIKKGFEKIKLN